MKIGYCSNDHYFQCEKDVANFKVELYNNSQDFSILLLFIKALYFTDTFQNVWFVYFCFTFIYCDGHVKIDTYMT